MMTITTIQIKKETRELLKSYGKKGETYDILIMRILKDYKKRQNND